VTRILMKNKHLLFCLFVFSVILAIYNFSPVSAGINSDPIFLLWKGCQYIIHKLILREHVYPQKCVMSPWYINRKSTSRFSIVQVFDRKVRGNTWWGFSSAICSTYAKRHGYGYVYAVVNQTNLNSTGATHKRTMHWARIPVLLWLLDHDNSVDWWLYLDMDAMINPFALKFPIAWIFSAMHESQGCVISSSQEARDLIFFSNADQEPHMPCSGSFLASNSSGDSLALWWNYAGDPYFDSNSEYDQHRVHELMYFQPDRFKFAVLDIRQFHFQRSSFLLHFSGLRHVSEDLFRHRILRFIREAGSISSLEISAALRRVERNETMKCFIDLGLNEYHQHDQRIDCGWDVI